MSALQSRYTPSWGWLGLQGVEDLVGDINSLPTNKQTLSESQVEPTTRGRVDSQCQPASFVWWKERGKGHYWLGSWIQPLPACKGLGTLMTDYFTLQQMNRAFVNIICGGAGWPTVQLLLELLHHRLFLLFRIYSTLASWAKTFYAKEKWVIKKHFSLSQPFTIFFSPLNPPPPTQHIIK